MPEPTTIALADDDDEHAALVTAWLTSRGHRVIRFNCGDALLDWAARTPGGADAVLTDFDMPGKDGLATCRALQALPGFCGTPTLFVTSSGSETLRTAARAAGARSLIRKDARMLPNLEAWLAEALGEVVGEAVS